MLAGGWGGHLLSAIHIVIPKFLQHILHNSNANPLPSSIQNKPNVSLTGNLYLIYKRPTTVQATEVATTGLSISDLDTPGSSPNSVVPGYPSRKM